MTRSQGIVYSNLTGKQIRIRRRHLWKGVFDMYLDAHAYKVITRRAVNVKLFLSVPEIKKILYFA